MGWKGRLAALSVLLAGCPAETNFFQCVEDGQCGGDGLCEPSQYCSFPDGDCESGRRYGNEAAPGVANQCVPVSETSSTGLGSTSSPGSSGPPTTGGPPTTTASDSTGVVDPLTTGPDSTGGSTTTAGGSSSTSLGETSTTATGSCADMVEDACITCAITGPCVAEANDCSADEACNALFPCLLSCQTDTCVDQCCADTPDSSAELYATAAACVELVCPDLAGTVLLCP